MYFLRKPIILTLAFLLSTQFIHSTTINPTIIIRNEIIDIPKVSGQKFIDAFLNEPQSLSAIRVLINIITRPHNNIPSSFHTEALLMESEGKIV